MCWEIILQCALWFVELCETSFASKHKAFLQVSYGLIFPRVLFVAQMNFSDNPKTLLCSFTSLLNSGCSKLPPALFSSKQRNQNLPLQMWNSRQRVIYFSFFSWVEELQKNTQIVWSTFDVTTDKYCSRDWCKVGEGEVKSSIWETEKDLLLCVIYGKIQSLCFEMSLDSIYNISELTFEMSFSLFFESLCVTNSRWSQKWGWHGCVLCCSLQTEV